jgi:hypothetical protein
MSNYNYAQGAIHIDHHKDLNIDVKNVDDAIRLMSAFMSDRAEDITPDSSSSVSPESNSGNSLFCRITKEAYDKGKAQQVEAELRSACVSAPKLVKTIRTNEALGYLDTQNLSSVELYELLNEHYHLPFKPHAFSVARSKRPLDFS